MCYPSPPPKAYAIEEESEAWLGDCVHLWKDGENISNMVQCRNKYDIKLLIGHVLTDKMIIDLNVLSASM